MRQRVLMDHVSHLRAFNRDYTVKLGLLDRSYLGSGLSLTQVRVLQEIALAGEDGTSARDIASRIGTDEGYLSRIIAGFEARGWVRRQQDPQDARRKRLWPTQAGRAAFAPLEAASKAMMEQLLSPVTEAGRDRICAALTEVQSLFAPPAGEITIRGPESGDLGWVLEAHARLYARDEGYNQEFEAVVAQILAEFARSTKALDRAFIAVDSHGQRLGSTFVVEESPGVARLRLVLLEPQARGRGLGKRLLDMALEHARASGCHEMVLWTHESHVAACAMYARAGFSLVSSQPAEAFGAKVVDQIWQKNLLP
ncbi:bifunctional helix-turn-helix transcriptional regulator/GNAT family N-acetyltransferase [Celeribacter neptunius]|uniref:Transcriptional regulator, MarR family with acetyltransferase activity n=1 Tax=Celeribacter neptunius TaxID=588602 RepID=A0A1I3IQH1_9RHOB|nr:bifunctional helix-turn-helix transcriptional regulator/GNAT family N-acetyltransferase [Celeribacter neptunius]SFI50214.1 transcriptional regulator, MarR family with acetyltransferase activity [Celeribacter neptunius]